LCNTVQDNIYCNLQSQIQQSFFLKSIIFLCTGKSSGNGKSEEFSPDFVMVSWSVISPLPSLL
jgi:hypothetical protein